MKTIVTINNSIRAKITDKCGLSCGFCHNEGTLVRRADSNRVSIFSKRNHCRLYPGEMSVDDNFLSLFKQAKYRLDVEDVHLTGGEPSLNMHVEDIIASLKGLGLTVKMTSNGETGGDRIKDIIDAGIDGINFSILGLTAEDFQRTQNNYHLDKSFYENKIRRMYEAIDLAIKEGIYVAANIVVSDFLSINKAIELINYYKNSLQIEIQPDLSNIKESESAIEELLVRVGATPIERKIIAGVSDERITYEVKNGVKIVNKKIRRIILDNACSGCPYSETDCVEGFSGPRVYIDAENNYYIGFCIMRMERTAPYDSFFSSQLCDEILSLYYNDYNNLIGKFCLVSFSKY